MRPALCLAISLAAALFAVVPARAQGFLSVNGRNHPELEWRVAETEHFQIIYPRHITGVEVEAASVAEETYAALSENLDVAFDRKIRIYLSDEDEIVNGFAVPIGAGHTNIWVHLNEAAAMWTGREKWIRKVVAHELAHIFHYRAVKSPMRPLDLGLALPRFWTEGLAQYQTERWDAYRGERWLRTAVLDDRLSYRDGQSIWNGRLMYSVGNAQVRFFATEYGDSTLAALLKHRSNLFLPGLRAHRFGKAFRDATGDSYRAFYDRWRRHINIQYNTIAGQMENADSLGVKALDLPGTYVRSIAHSADGLTVAAVVTESVDRPVSRLVVRSDSSKEWRVLANGGMAGPIDVAADGRTVAYVRLARGKNGSLYNDIFIADVASGKRRRLTQSRRASWPSFDPNGRRVAFVASEAGTGNVYVIDLVTGVERPATNLSGDEQVAHVAWHPVSDVIAYSRFDRGGARFIEAVDLRTGTVTKLTDGRNDDRHPIWSPDGSRIAYTSLQDAVPNVFIINTSGRNRVRVTALVTGADGFDWIASEGPASIGRTASDSSTTNGRIGIRVGHSKTHDDIFLVDANRVVADPDVELPHGMTDWMSHHPPRVVPSHVPPRPAIVENRYPYRSLPNLTHVATLAVPYYLTPGNYGVAAGTAWMEPLGKHLLVAVVGVSLPNTTTESTAKLIYINNVFRPQIETILQRVPESIVPYGDGLLRQRYSTIGLNVRWPLDLTSAPFINTEVAVRARYVDVDPLNPDAFADSGVPVPEPGHQGDVRVSFKLKKQLPYSHNVVHPLDGFGVRVRAMAAARSFSGREGFVRFDVAAFGIANGIGRDRLFAYGRAQLQRGDNLPQDYIGLTRIDGVHIVSPELIEISFSDVDRVRGYRRFVAGRGVLFGSVEHRIPIASSLRTRFLGVISLGATTVAAFADGALVSPDSEFSATDRRLGVGVEVKNAITFGGVVTIMHALGVAQPATHLGGRDYDLYYRVRAAVPF